MARARAEIFTNRILIFRRQQVGDEITTIGGLIGKVVSIKDETLVLETSHDRTHIRILKSAVQRVDVKAEDAQD